MGAERQSPEFLEGVQCFIRFTKDTLWADRLFLCPCSKCLFAYSIGLLMFRMTEGSTTTLCPRGNSPPLNWSPSSPRRSPILSESSHDERSLGSQPDGTVLIDDSHLALNSPDNEMRTFMKFIDELSLGFA
ncbi:uncharacterized protein LOC113294634 [Papaver somniferum]|nr:uncharacterized protein LOC113294634 [Papaver somniferum]